MMIEQTNYSMTLAPTAWAYDCSKKTLKAALLFSTNRLEAARYAKRVYKTDSRGMWSKIMSDAKKCLAACEKAGITLNNPLIEKDGCLFGAHGNGIAPYCPSKR